MNDNQLISMLMNGTDLEEVGKIEVEPIVVQPETLLPQQVQKVGENPLKKEQDPKPNSIKLSDYVYSLPAGNSSMLETCAIPNYRLAKCCANCAFSVYDPVLNSACCVKWECCIVPVYYCDNHKDPKDLISEDSEVEEKEEDKEEYKEENQLEILSEDQLAGAIVTEQPTTTLQEVVSSLDLSSDDSTFSLANDSLPPLYDGYEDKDLFLAASTNVPPFEPEIYKQAYIKKKYLQLYKEKYGSFEGAIN